MENEEKRGKYVLVSLKIEENGGMKWKIMKYKGKHGKHNKIMENMILFSYKIQETGGK